MISNSVPLDACFIAVTLPATQKLEFSLPESLTRRFHSSRDSPDLIPQRCCCWVCSIKLTVQH